MTEDKEHPHASAHAKGGSSNVPLLASTTHRGEGGQDARNGGVVLVGGVRGASMSR